jgi:hypothetical protein
MCDLYLVWKFDIVGYPSAFSLRNTVRDILFSCSGSFAQVEFYDLEECII